MHALLYVSYLIDTITLVEQCVLPVCSSVARMAVNAVTVYVVKQVQPEGENK